MVLDFSGNPIGDNEGVWRIVHGNTEGREVKEKRGKLSHKVAISPLMGLFLSFSPLQLFLPLGSSLRSKVLSLGKVYRDLNLLFSLPNLIALY